MTREEPSGNPDLFEVLLLNDDLTPMDFAVEILREIFNKSPEDATQIMLFTHNEGRGSCGTYQQDEALELFGRVAAKTAQHKWPMACAIAPSVALGRAITPTIPDDEEVQAPPKYTMSPGEEIILIGPIGAGKSTIGNLLARALGVPQLSMDEVRWSYYREIGFDERQQNEIAEKEGFAGVQRYWAF